MQAFRLLALSAAASIFWACQDPGSSPVIVEPVPCQNPDSLQLPRFRVTSHPRDTVLPEPVTRTLPNTHWASGDSVRAFFGGKPAKLVFTLRHEMYLLEYGATGEASLSLISHGDEGLGRKEGSINSPLFSPDGKKIVFAGTSLGFPGFILDAVGAGQRPRRVRLDQKGSNRTRITADPHWVVDGDKTWVYFASLSGLIGYSDHCHALPGGTYKVEVLPTGAVDTVFRITGIPGAYRGGVSKDLRWAGTSYATSVLYDRNDTSSVILAGGDQQCNPSMNPYPPTAVHTDYMMILAFGGDVDYHLVDGHTIREGEHENLWIYNKNDKIVWQAKRPDESVYSEYDKPEWSTHWDYATAVALRKGTGEADLYVIKIGDLMNAEEGKLNQAEAFLKIGDGGFNSDTYTHLWVEP